MEACTAQLVYSLTVCSASALLRRRCLSMRSVATVLLLTTTVLFMASSGVDAKPHAAVGRRSTTTSNEDGSAALCPECRHQQQLTEIEQTLGEDALIEMHKDLIKRKILDSLGMVQPPNITGLPRAHVPPVIRRQYEREKQRLLEEDERESTMGEENMRDGAYRHRRHSRVPDSRVFIFGRRMDQCDFTRPSSCLHFDLSAVKASGEFVSAELMVYRSGHHSLRSHSLSVSPLGFHNGTKADSHAHMTRYRELSKRRGWVGIDVSDITRRWLLVQGSQTALRFSCKTCAQYLPITTDDGDHQAYLVISTNQIPLPPHHRGKRQASECRLRPLKINFHEEGWNYIHEPVEFSPNYCSGACSVPSMFNLHVATGGHSTLMQHYGRAHNRPDILPCCSPTYYGRLSMLYLDQDGVPHLQNVRGMVAGGCGCR
ncbi:hypothetical protein CAPTEDRAFT_165201 [Capitella teleta]|uniref:TGF-beta family profile domain-containing protein n=1 Tax=Capitella teleta TaxID=283909 RepID=R7V0A1_CAPTE|nr:hypothetical protein CAPTEDRAFT_165201 [Capitella teleta]|eukprot:ELU11984.1 hypothetical protein CAPTEDRAFT_165201 [Capitella teleta]